jgi:predicted dehydrogenase
MPGTGQVRWGIIGTARIARKAFVPAVAAAGGVITTVAGRELSRASQYAAETGIARAVQGYQALLDDPDVDALYIPLPNALHAEWTARALQAGKAVLCEKPLCGTLAETEQVLAVARETGTPLWEAFVFPFHEQMARIRGLLADGAIGELREIQSGFHFMLDHPGDFRLRRGMAGGSLNDVGCYPVRLAVELLHGEQESAWATAILGGDGVDVDLQGSLGYSGHQRLTLSCGFLRSDDRFARLLGTAGQIHITDPFHPGPDDSFTLFEEGKEPRGYSSTDEVPSFTAAIRHMQRVVQGQEEPRHLAVDNSLRTARGLQALREAAARDQVSAGQPTGEQPGGEQPG